MFILAEQQLQSATCCLQSAQYYGSNANCHKLIFCQFSGILISNKYMLETLYYWKTLIGAFCSRERLEDTCCG
jgi:hypothetical protein